MTELFGVKVKNTPGMPSRLPSIILVVTALQILACNGLRLTNMTAPALQDPRKDMELHCRFDMGGEELYAVKWYKDDHEFFRYTPAATVKITQFPVDGVNVERKRTKCMPEGCDLLLTQLSRPQSSGAYRCEVSSEAPAFRLASQTHNVTVAAVPEERPRIDGLSESYFTGDLVIAQCTSGFGDPKPVLTWLVNKLEVPSKSVRDLSSDSHVDSPNDRIRLKNSISQLRLPLDKKLTQNRARTPLDITCRSSIDGINTMVAPPLTTTKTILVLDQNQLVNNQKLHSPYSSASKSVKRATIVFILTICARWC